MDFNNFDFESLMRSVEQSKDERKARAKYPNFDKYSQLIRECLVLNEKIQAIGIRPARR